MGTSHKEKIIKSVPASKYCMIHDINMSMTELICMAMRVSHATRPEASDNELGMKKRLLEEMEKIIEYEKRFCSNLKI
jgi:hypothetical protein